MEVNINTLSGLLQEAEIFVTDEELQPLFARAYDKERSRIEIKGFRKGKAPLSMIKKLYGEAIEHDILDDVATDFYQKAMDERNIRPIGQPAMVGMDYKRGNVFRFRIQYEVKPEIVLKQYKGLSVDKPVHRVSEEEINAEILRLRRINGTVLEVSEVTDAEHFVTGDVQELDPAGMPLIGRKTKNVRFYLNDDSLAAEIKQALGNAKSGQTYRIRVESIENDQKRPLDIDITVTKVEKIELPALDEAFVTRITNGKLTSVDEFRQSVRSELEKHWADWSERKLNNEIIAELVRLHEFPVPDALVRTLLDSYIEDIKGRSKNRKLPDDFDEEKFRNDSRSLAIWQAKWLLLKERIADAEKIVVTEEDIAQVAEADAARVGVDKNRLVNYYRESAGTRDHLLTEKIMKFLVAHATVSEKIVEEHDLRP